MEVVHPSDENKEENKFLPGYERPCRDSTEAVDQHQDKHQHDETGNDQLNGKQSAGSEAERTANDLKRVKLHQALEGQECSEARIDNSTGCSDSNIDEAASDVDEQDVVLERVVSPEQADADLATIRSMWELAAVYEFMSTFKYWLNFTQLYPLHDLEEALVKSPGPGLLAQLHVDLLRGIATRSQVGQNNWTSTLSARLLSEAYAMQLHPSRLPFRPVRGKEARGYAQLSAVDRVLTLKALADMRADREDMRNLVEDIVRGSLAPDGKKGGSGAATPPRRSARGSSGPPPPPALTAADMRGRHPLGQDAAGNSYHWYDMPYDHDTPVGPMGSRLYVEGPPRQQQQQQQDKAVKQEAADQEAVGGSGAAGGSGGQQAVVLGGPDVSKATNSNLHKPPLPPTRPVLSAGDGDGDGDATLAPAAAAEAPGAASSKPSSPRRADTSKEEQQPPPHIKLDPSSVQQQHVADTAAGRLDQAGLHHQQQQLSGEDCNEAGADPDPTDAVKQEDGTTKAAAAAAAGGAMANSLPADGEEAAGQGTALVTCPAAAAVDGVTGAAAAAAAVPQEGGGASSPPSRTASAVEAADSTPAAGKPRAQGKQGRGAGTATGAAADKASSRPRPSREPSSCGGTAARPSRKAAAAASAKIAGQLSGAKLEPSAASQSSGSAAAAAAGGADARTTAASRAARGQGSSRLSIASAADEASPPGAAGAAAGAAEKQLKEGGRGSKASGGQSRKRARSPSQAADDATMAQLLAGGRPTRRAAADAAAKIAVQSQNISISKLAEEAAAEREAAERAAAGDAAGRSGKGRSGKAVAAGGVGGASGRSAKKQKPRGPYVLPPDEVGGSWRLAADDIESLQALGEALSQSDEAADVEVGQLLLQQVVATLMARKQQEEKYARARSRVARSLGLDAPAAAAPRERAARQRKAVRYDFDDYDRHMRTAIRAAERGGVPELPPAPGRQPYTAPPYECEVRRGRSGGTLDDVEMIDSEAQLLRRKRLEKEQEAAATDDDQHQQAEDGAAEQGAGDQQQQQREEGQEEEDQAARIGEGDGGQHSDKVEGGAGRPLKQHQPAAKTAAPAADDSCASAPVVERKPPVIRTKQHRVPVAAHAAAVSSEEHSDSPATAGTGSGRPRRRAAAGVFAAVAAAAAASGGAEDTFYGTAAFMHAELNPVDTQPSTGQHTQRKEAAAPTPTAAAAAAAAAAQQTGAQGRHRLSVTHQQQQQQLQGSSDAVDGLLSSWEDGPALPPHGHFHSSSTHSFTGLAEQQEQQHRQQQQQQQSLQAAQLDVTRHPQQQQPMDAGRLAVSAGLPASLPCAPRACEAPGVPSALCDSSSRMPGWAADTRWPHVQAAAAAARAPQDTPWTQPAAQQQAQAFLPHMQQQQQQWHPAHQQQQQQQQRYVPQQWDVPSAVQNEPRQLPYAHAGSSGGGAGGLARASDEDLAISAVMAAARTAAAAPAPVAPAAVNGPACVTAADAEALLQRFDPQSLTAATAAALEAAAAAAGLSLPWGPAGP